MQSFDREYLKDIELSNYRYLSDVYVLNTFNGVPSPLNPLSSYRLSFKYDEELRYFVLSDDLYYYPSLNRKYPAKPGDYYNENKFHVSNTENAAKLYDIFDQTNLFIIQLDDESIFKNLGIIDIPIERDSGDSIRVYEDFDPTKFSINDPNFYRYVHMTVESVLINSHDGTPIEPYDGTDDTLSSLSTQDYEYSYGIDNMFNDIERRYEISDYFGYVVKPLFTEHANNDIIDNYVHMNITDDEKTSVNKFMNIYVNYKKEDDDTTTLYFNYNNFLASPYLKLDNGKTKTDIIPNTYLKLKSRESGILDIMLQFKYYDRTELYGYRNVILVSYEIHNTSDDKPKFLIRKIKQAERDSYRKYESQDLTITPLDVNVELDQTNKIFDVFIRIQHKYKVNSLINFKLDYPEQLIEPYGDMFENCKVIKENGVLDITTVRENIQQITIPFRTKINKEDYFYYLDRSYPIEIYDVNIIGGETNINSTSCGVGLLGFTSQNKDILSFDNVEKTEIRPVETEESTPENKNLILQRVKQ